MMTASELAEMLNGREYMSEITDQEEAQAKAAGLVVVFGGSDDLMEFRGEIHDEVYVPGTAYLTSAGLLRSECDDEECPYFAKLQDKAATIKAVWWTGKEAGDPGYAWTYQTDIPHTTFEIIDDGEQYCRGIVFALADIVTKAGD